MSEEYVVRDDEVDLMNDIRPPPSLDEVVDYWTKRIIEITEEQGRELQNLIDYIIYPHSHEEITIYAMALRHRLEEK